MKTTAERINPVPTFTPIRVEIILESKGELDALKDVVGGNRTAARAVSLHYGAGCKSSIDNMADALGSISQALWSFK